MVELLSLNSWADKHKRTLTTQFISPFEKEETEAQREVGLPWNHAVSWGVLVRDQLSWEVPLRAQETTGYLFLHPVTRACASPKEEDSPQSHQEPPGEVMKPVCRTDQVSVSL